MRTISNREAQLGSSTGSIIVVDVREPVEYKENHIPGALNFPSSNYNKSHYSGFRDLRIALICHSGNRATKVGEKLRQDGFVNVYLLETQMRDINNTHTSKGWSIDRQFRFTLGILLLIYLGLSSMYRYSIVIPILLCSGLIVTALIDKCYLRMGIAMLPWNKGKKN